MAKGRPPEPIFDPEQPGPLVQAAIHVDDRGRIQLPQKIIGPLDWIKRTTTTEALAVLISPGLIRLHSWQDAAPAILERRRQLIQQAAHEPNATDMLRSLEDRYKRFQIPLGARPTLTFEMILHLGISPFAPTSIYVWRVETVIELNSVSYRREQLRVSWEDLEDLPQ
jgi:hypothetical protein